MNTVLVPLLLFLSKSIFSPVDGFKRSDLFLDEPFFLGVPSADETAGDALNLDDDSNKALTNDQLDLQARLNVGKWGENDGDAESDEGYWPGRTSKVVLENAGTDVVKAFRQNLENQRKLSNDLDVVAAVKAIDTEITKCEDNCRGIDMPSDKWACILVCATKDKGPISQMADVLLYGIKTLCYTVNNFYSNFHKYRVKNLEIFQAIMNKIEAPLPVSGNVPLRTMLNKVIQDVFTTMKPFQTLLKDFKADMSGFESGLGLKANVLVGENPGCSMVDMKKAIRTVLGIISKDPSQADYIMLQGYSLFTALTKYVDEFPTKKEFSVLNQGLDILLGTNCGLFLYGETGQTSNCDQYGGFPVLNMPVPDFMWSSEVHDACEKEKRKMLSNKEREIARRKRESQVAEALAAAAEKKSVEPGNSQPPVQSVRRRRRSLVVGSK